MLPRQPLRFLLADDPGAGKTIMAGLFIKELIARGDLQRCLVVCPGSLAEQWQDELHRRFHLPFEILTNDKLEAARTANWFLENDLVIARLDKLSRDEDVQQKLSAPDCRFDLVICDEAHKLSATFFGGEVVFLAADRTRLEELEQATRSYLAWKSILADAEGGRPSLNLDNFQTIQAKAQRKTADQTVQSRIGETYQIVVTASQDDPKAQIVWKSARAAGSDPLAARAWKKLKSDGALVRDYAGSILRLDLDRVLWRGDSVSVRQLMDDYASYPYLQRLRDPLTLAHAIEDGVSSMTWTQDGFGYADSWDEAAQRFRGLRSAQNITVHEDDDGVLVRPEVALRQLESDGVTISGAPGVDVGAETTPEPDTPPPKQAKRFHGTVSLDPARVGRDASKVADEVIAHLTSLMGVDVEVTLEIDATMPNGAPENVVRTATENSRTLNFRSHGFETE